MLHDRLRFLKVLFFATTLATQLSCFPASDDGNAARPVAEARGPETASGTPESDVPVEALRSLEKVYVPLRPESMASLDDALSQKGYGNVMGSDFKPVFEHIDATFGPAVVAYSSGEWIESQTLFQPMSLTQWLEAALADSESSGVIINPGHPGQTLAIPRDEVAAALDWLPRRDPLPMEIHFAQ